MCKYIEFNANFLAFWIIENLLIFNCAHITFINRILDLFFLNNRMSWELQFILKYNL